MSGPWVEVGPERCSTQHPFIVASSPIELERARRQSWEKDAKSEEEVVSDLKEGVVSDLKVPFSFATRKNKKKANTEFS